MGYSQSLPAQAVSGIKLKLFEQFFADAPAVTIETMEILMDVEQMGQVLSSLEDSRLGRLVGLVDAFGDL
jgi:hypothetical protein